MSEHSDGSDSDFCAGFAKPVAAPPATRARTDAEKKLQRLINIGKAQKARCKRFWRQAGADVVAGASEVVSATSRTKREPISTARMSAPKQLMKQNRKSAFANVSRLARGGIVTSALLVLWGTPCRGRKAEATETRHGPTIESYHCIHLAD